MGIITGKTGDWELTIGLEVHAQIATKAKLFSRGGCAFGAEPNSNVNLFDAAMPGTLPVLNYSCVAKAVSAGLALNGKINLNSVFERKHYFYPDLPSGYQITQQSQPIITGGFVKLKSDKKLRIHHIHIEQDAGKSIHDLSPEQTYIDLNRAGIPLMEIVSEPDMQSAIEAAEYVNNLKLILQYAGASNANMEKGELRCDANVSVKKVGSDKLGTRCEIKNLNSTKSLVQAIEYEAALQVEILESGGVIEQQTKLFNVNFGKTISMRSKENATDYRYFPDPDLLPLKISEEYVAKIAAALPELPTQKKERYLQLGIAEYDTDVIINDIAVASYFDKLMNNNCNPKLAARWLTVEFFALLNKNNQKLENSKIQSQNFVELLKLIENSTISERAAKDVLVQMFETEKTATSIIEELNLGQISNEDTIRNFIIEILNQNQQKTLEYLAGKEKLFGFFVGQVMQRTNGRANPSLVNKLLQAELKKRNNE